MKLAAALPLACAAALLLLPAAPAAAQPDRIDRLVEGYMARENVPGTILYVLRDDAPATERAWGLADRATGAPMRIDQVQPLYSVSKQFAAATALKLVEQGRLDLDAPVGRYLPILAGEPALRVRHLLRHTSGLANLVGLDEVVAIEQAPPGTSSVAEMAALVARMPRRFAPGTRHSYSNGNYTMLAALIEAVTGRGFAEAQRELLLRPLGLDSLDECAALPPGTIAPGHRADGAHHMFPPNPEPSFAGNGGLCGDAGSLARWTRALGAGRVLRPDLLAEMQRGEAVAGGHVPPYGLGLSTLAIAGRPALWHAGVDEGWTAWAAYLPEERITVVLLANRGWLWASDVAVPVLRSFAGLAPPPPPRRLRLGAAERRALSGAFEDGLFEMELRAEADRLLLDNPAFGAPIELWKQPGGHFVAPAHPDVFALRRVGGRLEFDWQDHRSYLVRRAPPPARPE